MSLIQSFRDSFQFEGQKLRVYGHMSDPWFCGKDVATILGYKDHINSLKNNIKPKYKSKMEHINRGGYEPPLSNNEKNTIYILMNKAYIL